MKTEVSEIQTQINKLRNFIKKNSVTSEHRRYAQQEIQACLYRLFSCEKETKMNHAQKVYQEWQESNGKSLREIAESKKDAHVAFSDDLRYVIEMADGSCVIDTACSEYTTNTLDEFYDKIDEEDECEI